MKKLLPFSYFLFLIAIIFLVQYCTNENHKDNIYIKNSEWTFKVKSSNSNLIDTLKLSISTNKENEKTYKWFFTSSDGSNKDTSYSVVDSYNSNSVGIPMPNFKYLKLTQGVPNPTVYFPLEIGKETKVSVESVNDADHINLKFEGNTEIVGKTYYTNETVKDTCWLIKVSGKSSKNLSSKYYFNEKLGFVYMYYDFNSYKVEMSLTSYKIS